MPVPELAEAGGCLLCPTPKQEPSVTPARSIDHARRGCRIDRAADAALRLDEVDSHGGDAGGSDRANTVEHCLIDASLFDGHHCVRSAIEHSTMQTEGCTALFK